jgi:hypothetical protein
MSTQGQNEGFRVLDDFVCEAIPNPAVPQAPRDRRGQNAGAQVLSELVFPGAANERGTDPARARVVVEVTTQEPALVRELLAEFGSPSHGGRGRNQLGIEVEWVTLTGPKASDSADFIAFVVSNVTSAGTGLLSSWLYERLKGRKARLCLNGKQVALSPTEIEAAVVDAAVPQSEEGRPKDRP